MKGAEAKNPTLADVVCMGRACEAELEGDCDELGLSAAEAEAICDTFLTDEGVRAWLAVSVAADADELASVFEALCKVDCDAVSGCDRLVEGVVEGVKSSERDSN
jgi:hypothetical protein